MSTILSATARAPSTLPATLPIFPLSGVVLLPRARLPLHIFEPRYLAMVDDALAAPGRVIGMVQPAADTNESAPPVYNVGCAGRITSFAETEDGRCMIVLTGISRFTIAEEIKTQSPYRSIRANWSPYAADAEAPAGGGIDRVKLIAALQPYLKAQSIEADCKAIEEMADEDLVSTLVMICPLPPNEKQGLLEAADLPARAAMLTALLEMAALPPMDGNATH